MIPSLVIILVTAWTVTSTAISANTRAVEPCNQPTIQSYSVCDGNSIIFCEYDQAVAIADCFLAENTCKVVDGTPACVPRGPCTQNLPFYKVCGLDSIHFCRYDETIAIADCFLAGNTCKIVDGAPACVPR